ncbi:MAG: glycine/sarcosine/betaine reductase complex component C subunit alpha [Tissierellales bacterium]
MSDNIKNMIGKVFNDIADAMETGQFGQKVRVGITVLGSEHGVENIVRGAELAQKRSATVEVVLIGPKVDTELKTYEANTEEEQHKRMEELLDSGEINSAVTMHYTFPLGVSTVGRVVTPGKGREMFIATTTGTASTHRVEGMAKNALLGVITAKSMGVKKPTVGLLNVDGVRQVERALNELKSNGYELNFAESMRAEGGSVMRGNDLLTGTPDVMVTDSLTGNLLMKMFSSYTTGGDYESMGFGYGPGIGEDYERTILILSRASGVPVVANAIEFAAGLAQGSVATVSKEEFAKAKKAKFDDILKGLKKDTKKESSEDAGELVAPAKEVVTGSISGVDIMELEDAVIALWRSGIYAESGMGCTGPIVMVNEEKVNQAVEVLAKAGYIAGEATPC